MRVVEKGFVVDDIIPNTEAKLSSTTNQRNERANHTESDNENESFDHDPNNNNDDDDVVFVEPDSDSETDDVNKGNDTSTSKTQVASKIFNRRRSLRLSLMGNGTTSYTENEDAENDDGEPVAQPSTKKRKTSSKAGTAETNKAAGGKQKSRSRTSNSTKAVTAAAKAPSQTKHATPTSKSRKSAAKEDFGIKCNSELTFAILRQFKNPRKDSKSVRRYTATCKLCAKDPQRKSEISYQKGNNSNLKTHLKRIHTHAYAAIEREADERTLAKLGGKQEYTNEDVDTALLKFVIMKRLPLSKLESKYLRNLMKVCLFAKPNDSTKVACLKVKRKTARKKIQQMANAQRKKLLKSFEEVKFFSATSDIWSRNNISFIAVSVHFFEKDSVNLTSKFIACEHFEGRHVNERVARKLNAIFDRFGILGRVRHVTTDNAGEYSAAFKKYGPNYRAVHLLTSDGESAVATDADADADADDAARTSSENTTLKNAPTLPEADDESDSDNDDDPNLFVRNDDASDSDSADDRDPESFFIKNVDLLPNMNRVQCSMHKFDKIGKNDAKNAKGKDEMYDMIHGSVFGKLEAIWNQKESRLNAEKFYNITGRKLIGPHRIRFLKTLEAIENLLSIDRKKLDQACRAMGILPFDDMDYDFLEQYYEIINKIGMALRGLEGDSIPFGAYLPTLIGLRHALNEHADPQNVGENYYCMELAIAVRDGFEKRFAHLMDPANAESKPLYIAMITNPEYKMNFLGISRPDPRLVKKLKDMVLEAAMEIYNDNEKPVEQNEPEEPEPVKKKKSKRGSFRDLLVKNDISASIASVHDAKEMIKQEIDAYLSTPDTEDIKQELSKYPYIRELFRASNCIRSSEAICERMFSYAGHTGFWKFSPKEGMILTDKRGRLTPDFFEDLLLLHMNE